MMVLDVDNIIYENKINGVLQERFILMPDFNNKNLKNIEGGSYFILKIRRLILSFQI